MQEPNSPPESAAAATQADPAAGPAEAGEQTPKQVRTTDELLADAQAKAEEHRNAWLRALADAENARKRAQVDIASAHKYAAERLVESLLPVADSLEAALSVDGAGVDALRSGVELTLKQLHSSFERAQVAQVNPAPGEKFDPNWHHAVAAVEADATPNTVLSVMQKGYRLHDRMVRPARVTVARARAGSGAANDA